jgi:hypothetical protein
MPTLPVHKQAKLALDTALLLQQAQAAGVPAPEIIEQLAREHEALAGALQGDGAFGAAFTHALTQALNAKLTDPASHVPASEIARGVQGILKNRAADAQLSAALLRAPEFLTTIDALKTQLHSGDLPAGKLEEITRRLVQPADPAGAEPPVHVTASALGHYLLHQALAEVFEPAKGPLTRSLQTALLQAHPQMMPERAALVARGWLHDRFVAARGIADAMAPEGGARMEGLQQAEALLAHKHAAPAPQVQAPANIQPVATLGEQHERT